MQHQRQHQPQQIFYHFNSFGLGILASVCRIDCIMESDSQIPIPTEELSSVEKVINWLELPPDALQVWQFLHPWRIDCIMSLDSQTPVLSEEPSALGEAINWLELPLDVLSHIFLKLGAIHILYRAQYVCSVWRNLSREPLLFRSIDVRDGGELLKDAARHIEEILREAVDRSCGQLVEISMGDYASDELLAYIADKSGELRCLRLVCSGLICGDALINLAKKAVMLEKLEIGQCSFSGDTLDMLKTVGNACPQIMPESLNLSDWFNVNLEGDLMKICNKLIKLSLPNDSGL